RRGRYARRCPSGTTPPRSQRGAPPGRAAPSSGQRSRSDAVREVRPGGGTLGRMEELTQATAAFPRARPRRLRASAALRAMVRETRLSPDQLVLPLFAVPGQDVKEPIAAMPGQFHLSPDRLAETAARVHAAGVPAVLLFGVPDEKDEAASGAPEPSGIAQRA